MQAYSLRRSGAPAVLILKELPEPALRDGSVKIKTEYIGINFADILSRKGLYGWAPKRPYVPGMEASGTIVEVGKGVDSNRIGQRVLCGAKYGCYAEKIVVPQKQAIRALSGYTMPENAAFLVNYLTAWISLAELAQIQAGENILITAAAGGVGTAAVQLATQMGCNVYGLAGNTEKLKVIRQCGALEAYNYTLPGYKEELTKHIKGFDVVLELVGGTVYRDCTALLKPFGRTVIAGFASLNLQKWNPFSWWRTFRDMPRVKIWDLAQKSQGVLATHIGYLLDDEALMQETIHTLTEFVRQKDIKPIISQCFSFDQAAAAHTYVESRKSYGKVLLQVP